MSATTMAEGRHEVETCLVNDGDVSMYCEGTS